jgi:hypothetical protein
MLDKKVATGGKKMPASKNISPRQIETSMSKKYKGTAKVSQSTIDSIKKMGMTASLKKAASSNNSQYVEGVKRMYGASRLTAAKKALSLPAGRMSPRVAERAPSVTNRPSPRAAERATSTTKTKTVYNPRTGKPVTFPDKPKAAAKPKAKAPEPKYSRYQ